MARTLIEFTILPLRTSTNVATTTKEKVETMFRAHFPPSPTILTDDLEELLYSLAIEDDEVVSKREIIRATHKATLDKASKINDIINRTLRQLIRVASRQVRFLFDRCIKKKMQSSHFKKTTTIMLRKLGKKNYFKLSSFRPIALLDTLSKILKSIISKRLRYAIEAHDTLSNTQMKAKKQRSIDTTLQLIIEKIHTI
jgi:hypothetical protein